MDPYLLLCIQKCRNHGIVLDTNIFLLFLIGIWNPSAVTSGSIKRLQSKGYSLDDLKLLGSLVSLFSQRVVTQGIVAETCNLLDGDNQKNNGAIFRALASTLNSLFESQKSSKLLASQASFSKFGLVDTSVADLAKRGYLILTDDLPLHHFLRTSKLFTLNFTEIRGINWR